MNNDDISSVRFKVIVEEKRFNLLSDLALGLSDSTVTVVEKRFVDYVALLGRSRDSLIGVSYEDLGLLLETERTLGILKSNIKIIPILADWSWVGMN